jgi:nicotinamidase-related amidase
MTTALLLVDIPNDYFPGGPMALSGMTDAAAKAAGLLATFREKSLPIFHVRHLSLEDDAGFFVPGTVGSEINGTVTPEAGEPVTEKNAPNSFLGTGLEAKLRDDGITDLIIVGAMSHMCIDATTRAAKDMGFDCTVVRDACATLDMSFEGTVVPAAQVHAAFMGALGQAYATVVSASDAAGTL